jgi:hypothetical protein
MLRAVLGLILGPHVLDAVTEGLRAGMGLEPLPPGRLPAVERVPPAVTKLRPVLAIVGSQLGWDKLNWLSGLCHLATP